METGQELINTVDSPDEQSNGSIPSNDIEEQIVFQPTAPERTENKQQENLRNLRLEAL
jgi:hypothetical protein